MKKASVLYIGLSLCLFLFGCSSTTLRVVDTQAPRTSDRALPDDLLLDVGVVVFDSNIPEAYDDLVTRNITPEIRRAEANYISSYATDLLQSTGNWGAVRVLPQATYAVDVLVTGGILHSDGERQVLAVRVQDSRGEIWFERVYETLASKYHYALEIASNVEPFQTTYRLIADEMLEYVEELSIEEIEDIRLTTLMRYARDINPDAFADYVAETKDEEYEVVRLPASNDPNMRRVREVREREFLVIDTLAEYFSRFAWDMRIPYQNWREGTYTEAIDLREERNKSRSRLIAGTMMVLGGAVAQRSSSTITEYAGYASVIGGATEIIGGIQNRANVKIHASTLQELGVIAAKEIDPHTIELENSTIRLEGTASEQFLKARETLKQLYFEYLGLPDEDVEGDLESEAGIDESGENVTEEFFQDNG